MVFQAMQGDVRFQWSNCNSMGATYVGVITIVRGQPVTPTITAARRAARDSLPFPIEPQPTIHVRQYGFTTRLCLLP